MSQSDKMVEARPKRKASKEVTVAQSTQKRQKLKSSGPNDSKTTIMLTNVNAEEYKINPEEFEDLLPKRAEGVQISIQFRDADDNKVGTEIQLDSNSSKDDLNGLLYSVLKEAGIEEDENRTVD